MVELLLFKLIFDPLYLAQANACVESKINQ